MRFAGKKQYQFNPGPSVTVEVNPARPGAGPNSYLLPDIDPAHDSATIENHGPAPVHICEPPRSATAF